MLGFNIYTPITIPAWFINCNHVTFIFFVQLKEDLAATAEVVASIQNKTAAVLKVGVLCVLLYFTVFITASLY